MDTTRNVLRKTGNIMEKYVEILKDNDLRITPQRLEILKYLDVHRSHPTVDEIYSALKKDNPSISKTTVYNSVETLKEHGIIQSLTITGSEMRYDYENKMHHHFLCNECGRIIDINIECPNIGKVLKCGHKVIEVHGYFKGTCADCISKESEENES